MGPAGPNCNPAVASVLVFHSAVLADADAFAVLAQLLQASLLALARLEAFRRGLMRRRHRAMALGVVLLFLAAVLGLRERRLPAGKQRGDEKKST
jgi:hypothetical protein